MLDEEGGGGGGKAVKKLKNKLRCQLIQSLIITNFSIPVAVDYTAFLFIYTFYLAEHNLINRTGILATVVSHCCVILDILKCIQIPSKLL